MKTDTTMKTDNTMEKVTQEEEELLREVDNIEFYGRESELPILIEIYERLMEIDKKKLQYPMKLSELCLKTGRVEASINIGENVIKQDPTYKYMYLILAKAYIAYGKQKGRDTYKKAYDMGFTTLEKLKLKSKIKRLKKKVI